MRPHHIAIVCLFTFAAGAIGACGDLRAEDLRSLRVLGDDYPRAFFFRAAEGHARQQRVSYPQWEETFGRLMGIEGKVLDEEIPNTSRRNVEFFTRFKQRHGDQLVLLHYNGNARDPRFAGERFFAGHWLYFAGQTLTADLPAEEGVSEVKVESPERFQVGMGRYRTSNDDVGICELDDRGRPDWQRAEQVQLVAVDPQRKVIRVRRGCYGTKPRAFSAGKAHVAVHVTEGPWGRQSNIMWHYNYATCCPQDDHGRTAADVHAEELAARFAPGGELGAFDGLEFDVLAHSKRRYGRQGGVDCNGDGRADNGLIDGVDLYGIGVIRFLEQLRRRMGEEKLILADGHSDHHQRGFGVLNGIESEGWPTLSDHQIRDWSGGLNRHAYWARFARQPSFSYINHKFVEKTDRPGVPGRPDVPMSTHRLVMAAAMFTDAAICYSFAPASEPGERFGIWDELRMGTENRLGWLGKPLGPAVRTALGQPDLLRGTLSSPTTAVLGRFDGEGVRLRIDSGRLRIEADDPTADRVRFRLHGVPCKGPDLFVSLTAAAAPWDPYPARMARVMYVGVDTPDRLIDRYREPVTGMQRRGEPIGPIDPDSGASVGYAGPVQLAGQSREAFRAHPPYREGTTGMVFWQRDAAVPPGAVLALYTGMGPKSPGRSDGVVFAVEAATIAGGKPGPFQRILEHRQVESRWIEQRVDMKPHAGRTVRLRFVADAGPHDNATTDHAYWADARLGKPDARGRLPSSRGQRFMTFAGGEAFTSGFYFTELSGPTIDLVFEIESSQPVFLSKLSAHAAADVMYRAFEHGLVVANPAPHPVTLDLSDLLPGEKFRRLRGSSRQDPVANNGRPVGEKLVLAGKGALFLVRRE